jgi:hypothetical protein
MEAVVALAVIFALLYILGVLNAYTILLICVVAARVLLALMLVFFAVNLLMLIPARVVTARFVGFERNKRFECAVYEVEGVRYKNSFPAENVLRDRIYGGEKRVFLVNLSWKKKRIYAVDMHSLLIMVLGLVLSAASIVLLEWSVRMFEMF